MTPDDDDRPVSPALNAETAKRGRPSLLEPVELDRDAVQPFTRKLIGDIVWKISRNELASGEKLPSIEEMARAYSVGRSSIREAIRYMESTGLVQSFHGKGTFVIRFPASEGGLAFLDEIVDMRKMIEIHATKRAVDSRTEKDLDRLNRLLEEMSRTTMDFQRYIDADRAFHGTIIAAARNAFLPGIFRNISGIYSGMQNALIHFDPNVTTQSIVDHGRILDALRRRDREEAVHATEDHLDMIPRAFRSGSRNQGVSL
jgi:GntR family transcriptional regulator, transcriptional repressor for pyruvate dehydrogenase complex